MREASDWTKATRKNGGGIHIYIPMETLEKALSNAGYDIKSDNLEVRFTAMKDKSKKKRIYSRKN